MESPLGVGCIARFLDRLHRFYAEAGDSAPELDALLCHIYECNQLGQPVCSTDLVRALRFGTLPTLNTRLTRMLKSGLVKQVVGSDRRVRFIELTPKGIATLEQRLELLHGSGWQR